MCQSIPAGVSLTIELHGVRLRFLSRSVTLDDMNLRERVTAARRLRGWSIRAAAYAGGIANTTWGNWENGNVEEPSDKVRSAVSKAFDWPMDWPENPLPPNDHATYETLDAIATRLDAHERLLHHIARQLDVSLEDYVGDSPSAPPDGTPDPPTPCTSPQ